MVIVLRVIDDVRLTSKKEVMLTKKPEKPEARNMRGCARISANEWCRNAAGISVTSAAGTIHIRHTGAVK